MLGEGPCNPESLHVVAELADGIVFNRSIMLDALLAWATAAQEQRIPASDPNEHEPIEIPLAREPGGRFHLCSSGFVRVIGRDSHFKNRRAPWQEYARLGSDSIRRVQINVAEDKSYRVPFVRFLASHVEWWCLGDREQVAELLRHVHYLGRFRGTGHGRIVLPWLVDPCDSWGAGFPIMRRGVACRPLPLDYPGLSSGKRIGYSTLTYPYWNHAAESMAMLPDVRPFEASDP